MDIYRILEKLAVISNKQTLTEGQMKRSLEARAEKMSKADFVANAGEYGMSAKEAAEFWAAVNGEEEIDEAYDKLPVDQLGLDKFSQAALSGGQRKRDALANPNQTRMLAKKSAQQQPVKEVITTTVKKGDRVSVEGKPAVVVGQIPTQAGMAKYFAVQFDDKKYPEGTYDQVHANRLFPASVAEAKKAKPDFLDVDKDGDKKEPFKKAVNDKKVAESAKPDFLDLDKDGNKKEPMKKAAKDKNDARGSFQKQMGGSAKDLTKGLSIGTKKVNEASKNPFPGTPEYELRFGKDDASSAFDKKKISTGTVYSRKHQEEPEAADDDTPKKKGRPVGAKRRLGAKGPSVDSKLLTGKNKGGLKEQDNDSASDAILPLLKKFISIKSDPEDKQDLIKVYRAFEKSTALGMEKLKDQWGTNLDAEFYHYAKQNGLDMNDFDSEVNENIDPADQGEYDREGDMALNQIHQIADAVEELHSILDADENLPEWVQSKITKALDYIDTARDYLGAKGDQKHGMIPEKAPPGAKAERMVKHIKKGYAQDGKLSDREKGIAYATAWKAKKAGKVEEESTDTRDDRAERAGKRVARDLEYDMKHKGKDDDKAERAGKRVTKDIEYDEKVDETTVAGSVATGGEAPKSKGGMQFGKGVYEGAIAESFDKKLGSILNEGMNLTVSTDDQGQRNISVSATGADADSLGNMLKMAGLFSSEGYSRTCEHCHGIHEAGACQAEQVDEELANAPDEQYSDTDTMINTLSGGLNGPKLQSNPNNMGDNPLAMSRLGHTSSPSLNLGDIAEGVEKESTTRLWDLYRDYKAK
jgi:hypothetical protein